MSKVPQDCIGQRWAEEIAVLTEAAAKLRLEAAALARLHTPGNGWGPWRQGFDDLHERADKMDGLCDWLRQAPEPPREPHPGYSL